MPCREYDCYKDDSQSTFGHAAMVAVVGGRIPCLGIENEISINFSASAILFVVGFIIVVILLVVTTSSNEISNRFSFALVCFGLCL